METLLSMWILFLINFVMDLWFSGQQPGWLRFEYPIGGWGCGKLGSLYSVLVLLPFSDDVQDGNQVYRFPVDGCDSLLPLPWKKFGQAVLYFYLVAFTMGGQCSDLCIFSSSSLISNLPLHYLWLAVALVTAAVLGKYGIAYIKKNLLQDLLKVPVEICIQGKTFKVTGLVDTGNQLVDPLTRKPVVIVEYGVLKPYLPLELQNIIDAEGEVDLARLTEVVPSEGNTVSLRLIPFTTIGKRHGMLVGFRPDKITVFTGDQQVCKNDVVIGIYNRRLSPQGSYRALLHPDLIQAAAN